MRDLADDFRDMTDRPALLRLLRLFAGKQFKIAVVECASPVRRSRIVELLRGAASVAEVSLADVPADEAWDMVRRGAAGAGVIAVSGLEDLDPDRVSRTIAELNVHRTAFVRDVPVPWVLFVHPAQALALRMGAPDFCDFTSLWLREETSAEPTPAPAPSANSPLTLFERTGYRLAMVESCPWGLRAIAGPSCFRGPFTKHSRARR